MWYWRLWFAFGFGFGIDLVWFGLLDVRFWGYIFLKFFEGSWFVFGKNFALDSSKSKSVEYEYCVFGVAVELKCRNCNFFSIHSIIQTKKYICEGGFESRFLMLQTLLIDVHEPSNLVILQGK